MQHFFLTGTRDHSGKPWSFDLKLSPTQNSANNMYKMKVKELISFHHRALFSPTKDTWLKAIKENFFTTWYGISYKFVHKHV